MLSARPYGQRAVFKVSITPLQHQVATCCISATAYLFTVLVCILGLSFSVLAPIVMPIANITATAMKGQVSVEVRCISLLKCNLCVISVTAA